MWRGQQLSVIRPLSSTVQNPEMTRDLTLAGRHEHFPPRKSPCNSHTVCDLRKWETAKDRVWESYGKPKLAWHKKDDANELKLTSNNTVVWRVKRCGANVTMTAAPDWIYPTLSDVIVHICLFTERRAAIVLADSMGPLWSWRGSQGQRLAGRCTPTRLASALAPNPNKTTGLPNALVRAALEQRNGQAGYTALNSP